MEITSNQSKQVLSLVPNNPISLSGGFSYTDLALSLSFCLLYSSSIVYKFGKTSRFDFRGSLSTKKLADQGYLQMYKGYYNSNPNDFVE